MCRPTTCRTCGLTTWSGCGMHVAQVRASVPADLWCPGHPRPAEETARGGRSLLSRLRSRGEGRR